VDLGTGGTLTLTGADSDGAKLTGAGKLTAQDLEVVGGTGGWTATTANVTIASTATAGQSSITGGSSAVLTGGTDATITQNAGTSGNSLTLTTVTVDVSTAGSLVLKGDATNGAKVAMGANTSIIKAGSDSTNTVTSPAITGLTITDVVPKAESATGNDMALGSLVGASNAVLVAGTAADVTISKDTKVSGKT
jgi:hypothetical protein